MIRVTLMLREITLLQSSSMFWAIICPTTQNLVLVPSCGTNICANNNTSTVEISCWTNVGLMSAYVNYAVLNCQQL